VTTPHSSWAWRYDEAYQGSFGAFYDALTEATVQRIAAVRPPPARIVDFGAGTGRLALPLGRAGYSMVAVDPSAEMLSVLRAKAEKEGLAVETVCCRMQDEFQSPPFDLALCVFTVLLYLLDEAALTASVQRAASVLCTGGGLLFDIPSKQLFASYTRTAPGFVRDVRVIPETDVLFRYEENIRFADGERWVNYVDSFHIRHWEKAQVFTALEQAGFVIEKDLSSEFAGSGSSYFLAARKHPV
jgi:SAM-dependent methyltransferase